MAQNGDPPQHDTLTLQVRHSPTAAQRADRFETLPTVRLASRVGCCASERVARDVELLGQFWGVPLSDGHWACGRVLAIKKDSDQYFPGNSRIFLAALMDWESDDPPTSDAIAGSSVIAQGWAHVVTIQKHGRLVLGQRDLALDDIRGLREVTHRDGGTVMVYEGATPLRPATSSEAASLRVFSTGD